MVGDFNATHDHEPMRAVLDAGVRDAAEEAGSGWQPTWPTKRYGQDWVWPLLTIDHVLTSPHFDAVRTHTVEIPRTDHLTLVAELRRDPLQRGVQVAEPLPVARAEPPHTLCTPAGVVGGAT